MQSWRSPLGMDRLKVDHTLQKGDKMKIIIILTLFSIAISQDKMILKSVKK